MMNGRNEIRWAPRVPKWKIRRLYESDAKGILDEELLDDVGYALLDRCDSILTVAEAQGGRVRCPRCSTQGLKTILERPRHRGDVRDAVLKCHVCEWHTTWGEYHLSFKRKQLNAGGATKAFEAFAATFPVCSTPKQKLIAIDQLIHEFHYSLRKKPNLPTRPVGVNLIEGKLTDVVRFLDALTYGDQTAVELKEAREDWDRTQETYRRDFLGPLSRHPREKQRMSDKRQGSD